MNYSFYNYRIPYLLFDFLVFLNIFHYSHDLRPTSWTSRLSPVLPGIARHSLALPGTTRHCPEVLFTIRLPGNPRQSRRLRGTRNSFYHLSSVHSLY